MVYLRELSSSPCSIPGQNIALKCVSKFSTSIKAEADAMGAALSQSMIDGYYGRFNLMVEKLLYLAQLQKPVLGFSDSAGEDVFEQLKADALKLCPTYVHAQSKP